MQAFLPLYFLAVLEGFGEVGFSNYFGVFHVGNCAGNFKSFKVGAGGEIEALGGRV